MGVWLKFFHNNLDIKLIYCGEVTCFTCDASVKTGRELLDSFSLCMEYGIFGEGSQISTNQKRERTVFSLLIGRNLRPFPEITVLH